MASYKVISILDHDGARYDPGSVVDLTDGEAIALVDCGCVHPIAKHESDTRAEVIEKPEPVVRKRKTTED